MEGTEQKDYDAITEGKVGLTKDVTNQSGTGLVLVWLFACDTLNFPSNGRT